MPCRGQKSGEVSGHAAAKRHDDGVPPGAQLQQSIFESCFGLARLETLAGREGEKGCRSTATRKQTNEPPAVSAPHTLVRDDNLEKVGKRARDIRCGQFERAGSDDDGRRPRECTTRFDVKAISNRPLAGRDQFGGVSELEPRRSSSAR
jgi:hypothetical protein